MRNSSFVLAKEIRLKHKAPVLSIVVLDGSNQSIGQGSGIPTDESTSNIPDSTTNNTDDGSPTSPIAITSHRVLICSEEQFKVFVLFSYSLIPFCVCLQVFTLPNLRPYCKFKLTATEGTRVRKVNISQFTLKTGTKLLVDSILSQIFHSDNPNECYSESCLVCLDNMGQISIYTLPTLRRQILFSCIKASDINALSSVQFSPSPHALYLQSSSEFAQVTFSPQTLLSHSS